MTLHLRAFELDDTDAVVDLWREAGLLRPWNDPRADITRKLAVQPELFRVAVDEGSVVASVMAGYDGHRGWLYYLATAQSHRGRGIAHALIQEVEAKLTALGCPKVQLMVRQDNESVLEFYARQGYERSDVVTTGKRLIED